MPDRVSTLIDGRRSRLSRTLGRGLGRLSPPGDGLPPHVRRFLLEEAEELYWNELEWEHITGEERLEGGGLAELTFPGLLTFVRGLLLREALPDAGAPADPRPEVVEDLLAFLAGRVVEVQEALASAEDDDGPRLERELAMTDRLVDLVLYRGHELTAEEVERAEAARGHGGGAPAPDGAAG